MEIACHVGPVCRSVTMHIYGADAYVQHICRDIHWPCTIPVTQVTHMACPPGQPRWLEEGSDSGKDNNL